jgi:23S rRNA (guanosine2251-2'-O)-methyltransferase
MGRNSVREVLRHKPKSIEKVLVAKGQRDWGEELGRLLSGLKREEIDSEALSRLVGSDSHQSIVALLKEHPEDQSFGNFVEFIKTQDKGIILALDEVTDPHNLGAIFRAAECFGVWGLIWSKNRGSPITPTVHKVSAGASVLVPSFKVPNLAQALEKLKEAGCWVVACQNTPEADEVGKTKLPPKVVLVLGSEGSGLHVLTSKISDISVKIQLVGVIDSLNVSQAAAVLLHAISANN